MYCCLLFGVNVPPSKTAYILTNVGPWLGILNKYIFIFKFKYLTFKPENCLLQDIRE